MCVCVNACKWPRGTGYGRECVCASVRIVSRYQPAECVPKRDTTTTFGYFIPATARVLLLIVVIITAAAVGLPPVAIFLNFFFFEFFFIRRVFCLIFFRSAFVTVFGFDEISRPHRADMVSWSSCVRTKYAGHSHRLKSGKALLNTSHFAATDNVAGRLVVAAAAAVITATRNRCALLWLARLGVENGVYSQRG